MSRNLLKAKLQALSHLHSMPRMRHMAIRRVCTGACEKSICSYTGARCHPCHCSALRLAGGTAAQGGGLWRGLVRPGLRVRHAEGHERAGQVAGHVQRVLVRPRPARLTCRAFLASRLVRLVSLYAFACWHDTISVNSILTLCRVLCCFMTSYNGRHALVSKSHCLLGDCTVLTFVLCRAPTYTNTCRRLHLHLHVSPA